MRFRPQKSQGGNIVFSSRAEQEQKGTVRKANKAAALAAEKLRKPSINTLANPEEHRATWEIYTRMCGEETRTGKINYSKHLPALRNAVINEVLKKAGVYGANRGETEKKQIVIELKRGAAFHDDEIARQFVEKMTNGKEWLAQSAALRNITRAAEEIIYFAEREVEDLKKFGNLHKVHHANAANIIRHEPANILNSLTLKMANLWHIASAIREELVYAEIRRKML